jgi:hypothetical protein
MKIFKIPVRIPKTTEELEDLCKELNCKPKEIKRKLFERDMTMIKRNTNDNS